MSSVVAEKIALSAEVTPWVSNVEAETESEHKVVKTTPDAVLTLGQTRLPDVRRYQTTLSLEVDGIAIYHNMRSSSDDTMTIVQRAGYDCTYSIKAKGSGKGVGPAFRPY